MTEERILEIRRILSIYGRALKRIIDKELPDARAEFYAAKFERDRLLVISDEELTKLDRYLLRKLIKDVPELRGIYFKLRETLEDYINREDELEEELEELLKEIPPPVIPTLAPEFISIDESTGYLIYYSRIKKAYFLVRPSEYEETGGYIEE